MMAPGTVYMDIGDQLSSVHMDSGDGGVLQHRLHENVMLMFSNNSDWVLLNTDNLNTV